MRAELTVFVIPTSRLADSIVFYRDGIGLDLLEEWHDMGRGALLAASERCHVELIEMDTVEPPSEPCVTLGLELESGVDDVFERLRTLGATTKAPPRHRAWGKYGFGAFDPNGVPVNVYEASRDV